MKVKIFKGNISETIDVNNLEGELNGFISDKKVLDIKQSQSYNHETDLTFLVVSVFYE
ncbi:MULTISPECIES: hypothetical protein [unclassified Sedimentibacter]|uniref:hypothetical protein n=1 Tax=unclassified Sedimentibacter TaxID=2649220 RepID=UPI0027E1F67E|nr:hypothetical protein [Sedimentibacter sp. MB35-C1]WMJ77591.1 hypothetical protein RBQ61_01300 [Sedimentibacter sp. MB35-C1]